MRQFFWPVLSIAALLGACDSNSSVQIRTSSTSDKGGALKVVDTLQCPQTEDVLTRQGSAQADGRSCVYVGPRGSEVKLTLISLQDTSAQAYLRALEQDLSHLIPSAADSFSQSSTEPKGADKIDPPSSYVAETQERAQVRLPGLAVDAEGDKASIRLPGMKIEADGDRSTVRIGGLVIKSDNSDGPKQVNMAAHSGTDGTSSQDLVNVQSHSGLTQVRAQTVSGNIRSTYRLYTKREGVDGWRSVGFEARGPAGGPIVVAEVRSRADNDERVFDAAKALVHLNVGK